MMKKILLVLCTLNAFAFYAYGLQELSSQQVERVKKVKELLTDSDTRTLTETIHEIQKSPVVEGELQIREAIAQTYDELLKKYQPESQAARIRLLDKVRMGMAYFQLGGPDTEGERESGLSILIRRKLKEHLPPELRADERFFKSLD